jgi:hypothetical protein
MKASLRFVAAGAALGAILGAVGGWIYSRRTEGQGGELMEIDRSKLFHLGTAVVGILRQIVELSAR